MFKHKWAIAVSAILFSAALAGCGGVGGSVPTLLGQSQLISSPLTEQ